MQHSKKLKFKPGDKVRIMYEGVYWYGEVTIPKEDESKFMPDSGDCPLNYWYYPNSELELITEEDTKE